MATITTTNLQIYDNLVSTAALTRIANSFEDIISGTNTALSFVSNEFRGDYDRRSVWARPTGGVVPINIASRTEYTPKAASQIEFVKAKFRRGDAYEGLLGALGQINQSMADFRQIAGDIIGTSITEKLLSLALGAAFTAIDEQPNSSIGAANTDTNFSFSDLNRARFLLGSNFREIGALVCHSGALEQMLASAISLDSLDTVGGTVISTGQISTSQLGTGTALGLPVIVYDSDELIDTTTVSGETIYKCLLLTRDAIRIENAGTDLSGTDIVPQVHGTAIFTKQESDYSLGLKGYTWTGTSGQSTAQLTDAEITSDANWNLVEPSFKNSAGVIYRFRST